MGSETVIGKPWARIPGESSRAYQGFTSYLQLGTVRSLKKAVDHANSQPDRPKHSVKSFERWSAKHRWVERVEAYDSDQLMEDIAERTAVREKAKQAVYADVPLLLSELRGLALGRLSPGDQKVLTDRNGAPRTTLVQKPDGEVVEVALTKEVVAPKVRTHVLEFLLGVAGIMAPRRMEITGVDGDELRADIRAGVRSLDPELLAGLCTLLGVDSGSAKIPADQKKTQAKK